MFFVYPEFAPEMLRLVGKRLLIAFVQLSEAADWSSGLLLFLPPKAGSVWRYHFGLSPTKISTRGGAPKWLASLRFPQSLSMQQAVPLNKVGCNQSDQGVPNQVSGAFELLLESLFSLP